MINPSPVRYRYLDSSRGIAALIVLLSHFQLTVLPQLNNSPFSLTPFKLLIDGQAAILYFFILSGFVLTLSLGDTNEFSISGYLKFIASRFFRIFPAFIFTLIFTRIILYCINDRPENWLAQYWQSSGGIKSLITQSILIIRIPYDPVMRLIPQDWTLTIEIAISFLLPLLAFASRKNSIVLLMSVYGAVKFLNLDPFVFDFSLGVFIAVNRISLKEKWLTTKWKTIILIIALSLICADYLIPEQMNLVDFILIHHKSWGIAILLWALISSEKMQSILSAKSIVFLGKISYSFYLLHLIILLVVTSFFNDLNPLLLFIVYLSLVILSSWIIFNVIEVPFNKLGKKVFENLRRL